MKLPIGLRWSRSCIRTLACRRNQALKLVKCLLLTIGVLAGYAIQCIILKARANTRASSFLTSSPGKEFGVGQLPNGKIKNKAPADYVANKEIFPSGPDNHLLDPHFFGPDALNTMKKATATAADADVAEIYEHFCTLREQRIIGEIRKICGIRALTLDLG